MNTITRNYNINIYSDFQDCKEKVLIPVLVNGSNITEIINGSEHLNNYDGVFTKNINFKLGIKTADCAPVCYGDGATIGIAHLGWRGLYTNLNSDMIKNFNISNLSIYIGPFIHKFEIKKDDCYDKLKVNFSNYIEYENSKIYFNFKNALLSIFPKDMVKFDDRDTFDDLSLPSYRRDKTKNRLLTVISYKQYEKN